MYGFIYITTNHINGKKYIGQKKYDKYGHWENYLGSGIYLTRAIEKYGVENFSKEIIEECESKELLNERETHWISFYNAVDSDDFYNIASGGDGGNTISGYNDEQLKKYCQKLSKVRKGVINQGKDNPMSKQVICLNNMQIFDTTVDAAKYGNTKDYLVQACCSLKTKMRTAGNDPMTNERLQWEYYDSNKTYEYIPFIKEKVDYINEVYCINTKEMFKNATVAGKVYNISNSSISQCCNNKLLSAGKHPLTKQPLVWCYKKDIDLSEEKLKYVLERYSENYKNRSKRLCKRIKCLNTNKIFNSLTEAMEWCNGNFNNFKRTLKSDGIYYYKKHPDTGEKLRWVYV